jgi:hypothetical protein
VSGQCNIKTVAGIEDFVRYIRRTEGRDAQQLLNVRIPFAHLSKSLKVRKVEFMLSDYLILSELKTRNS